MSRTPTVPDGVVPAPSDGADSVAAGADAERDPSPVLGPDPRAVYREALLELAAADPRVICLDSDTGGLEDTFGERFPERYVNVGIAEANLMTVAAGLARRGFVPYVHTMATFATLRAGEFLKLDVVGNRLPVRVIATHGGLAAAHFGTSHFALEDLAVTRALADLAVVVPGDARQIGAATRQLHELPGPGYLRLGRSATPVPPGPAPGFLLGRARVLREGADITLVAAGPLPLLFALEAAQELAGDGIGAQVLDLHTPHPLDQDGLLAGCRGRAGVVTVEEHRPQGGLGDAVAEVVSAELALPLRRLAVRGRPGARVAGQRAALEAHGVSTGAVVDAARELVARSTAAGWDRRPRERTTGRTTRTSDRRATAAPPDDEVMTMAGSALVPDEDRIRYVQSVFQRVLKPRKDVSPDDDFFALGGTSLTAMEVIDLIEAEQGLRVPVRNFYQATIVRELAGELPPAAAESDGGV
ncbi:transketolase C-terminal domain-containing protein [Streptomyces sp. NPDC055025]